MCVIESWIVSCEVNNLQFEVEGDKYMKEIIWGGFSEGVITLLENGNV